MRGQRTILYAVVYAGGVRSRHHSMARAGKVARNEATHRGGQEHWVVKVYPDGRSHSFRNLQPADSEEYPS